MRRSSANKNTNAKNEHENNEHISKQEHKQFFCHIYIDSHTMSDIVQSMFTSVLLYMFVVISHCFSIYFTCYVTSYDVSISCVSVHVNSILRCRLSWFMCRCVCRYACVWKCDTVCMYLCMHTYIHT